MKKLVLILLSVCSFCILLSACGGIGYEKGKTFDEAFLSSVSLQGMPLPACEEYALNSKTEGRESLRFETELADLEAYIRTVLAYMSEREDIYYFGIQRSAGLLGELVPHKVTHKLDGDFQWESGYFGYAFSYSLTDEVSDQGACSTHKQYTDPVRIEFEYDKEKKVATVTVTTNASFASGCIDGSLFSPYVFKLDHTGSYYRLAGITQDLSGEITLPETHGGLPVKEIDSWGFNANGDTGSTDGVTGVIIPDCYEEIGYKAFNKMPNLKKVVIGNGVKHIGTSAFERCRSLETVVFGSSVESIYAGAFKDCEGLDNVSLPASLKEITSDAFTGCTSLRSIVIPQGVTRILSNAFYGNDSLTDIYCEIGSQPDTWEPDWCGNTDHYSVNNDVKVTFGYGGEQPAVHYCVSYDEDGDRYLPIYLEKPAYLYTPGSEVVFYLAPVEDRDMAALAMYLNGELCGIGEAVEVTAEDGTKTLWKYSFTMPHGHAAISFQAVSGDT